MNRNKAYHAAIEQAAYYIVPAPGYLLISGDTRRDYLQRQTSNDLSQLVPNRALPTLLPTATGRILEVFTLLAEDEQLGLISQPGHGSGLAAYFQKHRFFNDQVDIKDEGSAWMQMELHGPRAAEALSKLGFAKAPALDEGLETTWQGQPLRAIGEEGFGQPLKIRVLAPTGASQQLVQLLANLEELDLATRRILRVEARVAGDPEFNGEYTPFEVGLDRLVSANKGCYTGQEVLARQVTYDKIVRKLTLLRATETLESGAVVHAEGKPIGKITSTALSPRFGVLALAVLRRPYDESDTMLEILQNRRSILATVN
ncbi:MAG: glycine cleavage T C-terminal barrel domain-containing protein [Anaerolineales bacterium]